MSTMKSFFHPTLIETLKKVPGRKQRQKKTMWLHAATKFLIAKVKELRLKVGHSASLKTKKQMWSKIAEELEERGHNFNSQQVETKVFGLERQYKRMRLTNSKTGRNRQTCPFQSELDDLLREKKSINPEYIHDTEPDDNCSDFDDNVENSSLSDFKLFDNGVKLDISSYPHMNIRISTKGKRPMRSLTPSDKVHAIQRIHDGESKASVARDIGVPESTLRGWCKNEDKLRFMSRQAAAEKIGDPLTLKFEANTSTLAGPPEKRQRIDSSTVLNFSNKIKFDEINAFKRTPINGLDFGTTKALTELSNFNALTSDYGIYNGSPKTKLYGADISRTADPSIAATSPLSSLTNLSGLTGIGQSPLAISFSELTSNLNLLAQLNPGLAVMSGLNGLTTTSLRNSKQKPHSQGQSPRADPSERQTVLTVKNWAKQKSSTPNSCESTSFGINLCPKESKSQLKNSSNNLVQQNQIGATLPSLNTMPDDPLLYWLKSQQAILGLNNLYSQTPTLGPQSPSIRPSTPHQNQQATTPPIIPNPLTPSSTPSGSLDDKNAAWFNWCKAFGASLTSLTPAAAMAALQATANPNTAALLDDTNEASCAVQKRDFENILYSQLTKDSISSQSPQLSPLANHLKKDLTCADNTSNRPEDLSAKSSKARSLTPSYLPDTILCPERDEEQSLSIRSSPAPGADYDKLHMPRNSVAECRDVLDNLLYKINSDVNIASETDIGFSNDTTSEGRPIHKENNLIMRTNDEDWMKYNETMYTEEADTDYIEAIMHGEKFLQWLEKCGDTRVTSVQMMQLRYLLSSIKREVEDKLSVPDQNDDCHTLKTIEINDSCDESSRPNERRRK